MKANPYEVWTAPVKYEDSPAQKIIPVIIYEVADSKYAVIPIYTIIPITSHEPRINLPGEYAILCREEAGLKETSTARCSKLVDIQESILIHKIGKLHPLDIMGIEDALADVVSKSAKKDRRA